MTVVETPVDIIVDPGATFHMLVTRADSSTNPVTPIPLSGYRARMQVRLKAGRTGTPLLDLSSEGDSPRLTLEPDSATGVVAIRMTASDTRLLSKNCAYDLFLIKLDDADEAVRLLKGLVTVSKSVTVDGDSGIPSQSSDNFVDGGGA